MSDEILQEVGQHFVMKVLLLLDIVKIDLLGCSKVATAVVVLANDTLSTLSIECCCVITLPESAAASLFLPSITTRGFFFFSWAVSTLVA